MMAIDLILIGLVIFTIGMFILCLHTQSEQVNLEGFFVDTQRNLEKRMRMIEARIVRQEQMLQLEELRYSDAHKQLTKKEGK